MVKLGTLIDQIRGVSYKPNDVSGVIDESHSAILRAHNIQDDGLNFEDLVYIDKKKIKNQQYLKKGDIVICASSGSKHLVGKAAQVSCDIQIAFGAFCKVVRTEKIHSPYLGNFFRGKHYRRIISDLSAGANINNLRSEHIDNLMIPLPPLETQKQIAKTLDTTAELLAMRKQQFAELDNLIKSTFYDMFGDPVTNEKGWESKKLNTLVSKLGDGLHGTPEYSADGEYYFINGNNLNDGTISVSNKTKKVAAAEFDKYKKELNSNTMLVSINGTIGNVAFYNKEKIVLGKSACYFNVLDFVNKKYLYYILKSDYFFRYASDNATGSTIKNVSLKSMREFPVPYPPIQLQTQFVNIVTKIEEQKALVKKAIDETQYLLDSLMSQYFE